MRSFFGLVALIFGLSASVTLSYAADYAVPLARHAERAPYIDRGPNPYCGPRCGCPTVVQVRHKSLQQAYPSGFDPRTRDEPQYYYGPVRKYVRYVNPLDPERVLSY
jgi:hypothetical protein